MILLIVVNVVMGTSRPLLYMCGRPFVAFLKTFGQLGIAIYAAGIFSCVGGLILSVGAIATVGTAPLWPGRLFHSRSVSSADEPDGSMSHRLRPPPYAFQKQVSLVGLCSIILVYTLRRTNLILLFSDEVACVGFYRLLVLSFGLLFYANEFYGCCSYPR